MDSQVKINIEYILLSVCRRERNGEKEWKGRNEAAHSQYASRSF